MTKHVFAVERAAARLNAAVRLERARQHVRECERYGFRVTNQLFAELQAAEKAYESATRADRIWLT
jgi:hypothetical protein